MKTKNRIIKAFVVVLIVGIGVINNMNYKINITDSTYSITNIENGIQAKTDSSEVYTNDIITYTKSILKSGLQHLISNL